MEGSCLRDKAEAMPTALGEPLRCTLGAGNEQNAQRRMRSAATEATTFKQSGEWFAIKICIQYAKTTQY